MEETFILFNCGIQGMNEYSEGLSANESPRNSQAMEP